MKDIQDLIPDNMFEIERFVVLKVFKNKKLCGYIKLHHAHSYGYSWNAWDCTKGKYDSKSWDPGGMFLGSGKEGIDTNRFASLEEARQDAENKIIQLFGTK